MYIIIGTLIFAYIGYVFSKTVVSILFSIIVEMFDSIDRRRNHRRY